MFDDDERKHFLCFEKSQLLKEYWHQDLRFTVEFQKCAVVRSVAVAN